MEILTVTSPAFVSGGPIPPVHTGDGEDVSPALCLTGLCPEAASLAVVLDDLDVPFFRNYAHWLLWNLPPGEEIPARIPHGPLTLHGAVQGVAYGKNRYRGPLPPSFLKKPHRYVFRVYALDCRLALPPSAKRRHLMAAMEGRILQEGSLMGLYRCK